MLLITRILNVVLSILHRRQIFMQKILPHVGRLYMDMTVKNIGVSGLEIKKNTLNQK